ncbi:MAG: VCBS repeat-containing protein [Gemmataceae bacterium]|nr:VCBS repeat-containing protein [Gemmataceae bacterium]
MSKSRGGRPPAPRLGVEVLEDRSTPAYLTNPGATIAVGRVFPTGAPVPQENNIVMGTGAGGGPVVQIFNLAGQSLGAFFAYDPGMRQGVDVAVGDVNGDGLDEIITAPGPGGGPNVKVFDRTGKQLASFFAYEAGFRGGVTVAAGDLTGDGKAEIVTGPGPGGGPLARVFSPTGKLLNSVVTFDVTFRGGVNVAVGDVNGDGRNEIIAGAGVGGGPLVQTFTRTGDRLGAFFAFDQNSRTGVTVASGDTDLNGTDEIWTTRGPGSDSTVRGYRLDGTNLSSFLAYEDAYFGGVNFAVGDANADGIDDVDTVRATGPYNQAPEVFAGARGLVPQGAFQTLDIGFYAADSLWTYYFPVGFTTDRRFPVLFAFDPAGNRSNGINGVYDPEIKSAADRLGFVVATSKYFRSGPNGGAIDGAPLGFSFDPTTGQTNVGQGYLNLIAQIREVLGRFTNSDQTRTILFGYGEGGDVAHALNFIDPTLADAIVTDEGPVYGTRVLVPGDPQSTFVYGPPFDQYATQFADEIRSAQQGARSRQLFEFVRRDSPATDPWFREITRDFDTIYPNLGYTGTLWTYDAAGAPASAPIPDYTPIFTDLFNQPDWINPP